MPCISQRTRRFGGSYRLHLQDRQLKHARNLQKQAASSARNYTALQLKSPRALCLLLRETHLCNSHFYFMKIVKSRKLRLSGHVYERGKTKCYADFGKIILFKTVTQITMTLMEERHEKYPEGVGDGWSWLRIMSNLCNRWFGYQPMPRICISSWPP